jgi:inward rectifier potassium channel
MIKMPRKISSRPLDQELGFGKNVTTAGRMMNPDGRFNVERQYLSWWDNTYFYLVTMPWRYFFLLVFFCFLIINLLFAAIYISIGIDQLSGIPSGTLWEQYAATFFFSTQTLTTVGYGQISPEGFAANMVASLESFSGLLAFALISGLLYGRFSRPSAKVVFSDHILVAPYRNSRGLMFRMGNARKSELIETEVQVILALNQTDEEGEVVRKFYNLDLEFAKVSFFALSWTVVHDLTEKSPLWGFSGEELQEANAEFMVLLKGTDEANQQLVHARHSYVAGDMVWNARFRPVITRNARGLPHVLVRYIDLHEVLP